jgi:hypothetical protein
VEAWISSAASAPGRRQPSAYRPNAFCTPDPPLGLAPAPTGG